MDSTAPGHCQRTNGLRYLSTFPGADREKNRHHHSQIQCYSMDRCGNSMVDRVMMGTCKPGNGISYVRSRAFVNEKVSDSPPPDKSVQGDNIKGQYDSSRDDGNPKVLIRNVEAYTVRSV